MIELSEIVSRRGERALFAPVSGHVKAGQYVEVVGPNGAGKTTLLRTLVGLHSQYSGEVQVAGELDDAGLIYQGHTLGLDELLTPLENLRWFAALESLTPSLDEVSRLLQGVGVHEYAMTPLQRLSQGQRRRVAMARWQQSTAKLWVLDEPLTALDTAGQALLVDMITRHCAAGGAVVCATHSPLPMQAVDTTEWLIEPVPLEQHL